MKHFQWSVFPGFGLFLPALAFAVPLEHLPRNGVCGVIGFDQSEPWMVSLAKSGDVVVHCIVPEEGAAQELARKADLAGLGGKLLVESIPATPVPYRDNLLNALVVRKTEALNLDLEAALKTVAPGGHLCVQEKDGTWKTTKRERPGGMDSWTHNYRNAGGNSGVSTDQIVEFPLGLRWNDDLPFNLKTNQENSNAWTNTRAIAVVDGRVYYVTDCARENLKRTAAEMVSSKDTQDMILVARDAWNGTQLWRRNLGPIFYGGLFYTARAPMVAMNDKVYAVNKDQELIEFDGANGEILRTFQTRFMTSHLLLMDGILVAATWKGGDDVGAKKGIDRRPLDITITEGTMEAFDLKSGNRTWENKRLATSLRGADGRIYLVERSGADNFEIAKVLKAKRRGVELEETEGRGSQKVVALDLKTGRELWERLPSVFDATAVDHLAVGVAGLEGVAISKNTYAITNTAAGSGRESVWLDGASGKTLARKLNAGFPLLHDHHVHLAGKAYDPKTGEPVSTVKGVSVGATVCTPQVYVNGIITQNRSTNYKVDGKSRSFGAARGSCMFAAIPANGAFYTAQTYCACAPGTAPGFIAFGPIGTEPSSEQLKTGSQLVKGPAYGEQTGKGKDGWYTFMGNAGRGNSNPATVTPGEKAGILWEKQIAKPISNSNVEGSWKDSLSGLITAPVSSRGHVFAADQHRRKMVMLGSEDGEVVWEKYIGGRVTTPPTVYQDLCLFGASDGYVYALDVIEGALAWKLRMGPGERRMISYAQPESPWSVFSSILVAEDGVAYASAGRSTGAESGIVVRAFRPGDGEVLWSQVIAYPDRRSEHINDVMYLHGDELHLMKSVFDRKSGDKLPNALLEYSSEVRAWNSAQKLAIQEKKEVPPKPEPPVDQAMHNLGIEGIASPNWTRLGDRRRRSTKIDGVVGAILAWDDTVAVNQYGRAYNREGTKFLWTSTAPNEQITAIAMSKNGVVFGGGLYPEDGSAKGFVRVVDRTTGKTLSSHVFPAPLSFQGLALADDRIYATFENGRFVCLAGE